MKQNKFNIDFSKMSINSSLGYLAYGDLAFKAWREIKKANNLKNNNEEE